MKSTHTGNLYLSWLPKLATQAHVVPGISHTSLLYIKMLCNTVCKVSYDKDKCLILYNNKILWQGTREPYTILWILPLNTRTPLDNLPVHTSTSGTQYADNAYQITSKGDLTRYLHRCLFYPPKQTLIKDIQNNQLTTWPGLTTTVVDKYLPDSSPATDKVYMKRHRNCMWLLTPTPCKSMCQPQPIVLLLSVPSQLRYTGTVYNIVDPPTKYQNTTRQSPCPHKHIRHTVR